MAGQEFFAGGCGCDHSGAGLTARTEAPERGAASRRSLLRGVAAAALAGPALLAAACSSGSSSTNTAQTGSTGSTGGTATGGTGTTPGGATPGGQTGTPAGSTGDTTGGGTGGLAPGPDTADPALLASKYQGLKPFAVAPAPPAAKPVNTAVALPPVVDHIPTTEKICFLTIDDGAEKDPLFLQMVKDFRVPITLFLTDAMIRDDYGYFTKLRDTGYCTIQNHTLTHPNMVELNLDRQRHEISGQQQKLTKEYGHAPYLFRAPYGNSNANTQQACKEVGLKAIMRWRASFQKQGFQWQAADQKLRPGDILLAHFRGPKSLGSGWPPMHQLMINLFKIVQEQGYTFARLEDYV